MQTLREFTRKTKRGNILKIVREHYLRTDLPCGSDLCKKCCQKEHEIILNSKLMIKSSLFTFPHYLVLDTNIVLHQIDVLETDTIYNVIIFSTVLNEVKHRNSVIYKRIYDIIQDKSRAFYVFVNEHHVNTYVERKPGESSNDRNDRAIRYATKWYDKHLSEAQADVPSSKQPNPQVTRVVLLTDDYNNCLRAKEDGILAVTAEEYIKSMTDHPMLIDKYSSRSIEKENDSKPIFPTHLSSQQILDGVRRKTLLQGTFQASRENFLEGTVAVEGYESPILIQGREALNRAIHGDIVAVKLLPEDQWSIPSEMVLEEADDQTNDIATEIEKTLSAAIKTAAPAKLKQPTGKVLGIISRKKRQYCGILKLNVLESATRHIFVPADRKIPKIGVETRQASKLKDQRIIVAIDTWPRTSRYPSGHFVRSLGQLGDVETESEVILLEHDVPHCKFAEEVLNCLPKMPWTITQQDLEKRIDLTNICVCSVDPPGCTDIDDALHCRQLPNGNFEVGVHIADVTHFIRPGNALDKEAANRGTTVYLVDRRIDMIPELLSSNLCSLIEGQLRFAFSCIWEMDANANVINVNFHKSIIKSKAALTYEQAQLLIDDSNQHNDLAKSLRNLNCLAKFLKSRRIENGALLLASPEIRFHVDSETHEPLEVAAKKLLETNSMVEEFMLLANISVAQHILREFPECALLRRHPKPPPANFDPLKKAAENQGFEMNIHSGRAFAESLDGCVKSDNAYFNTMFRILATRCMMQAVYFISGTLQEDQFFHYGLAVPIYTHFTSPIRRYSDVMVHRLLAASIGADCTYAALLDKTSNEELCHNLNYRHKMAQYAGRASVIFNTHLFFKGKTQNEEGYILFVRKNALQVLIPKFGLEGIIYLNPLKCDEKKLPEGVNFVFNEEDYTQRCGDIVFRVFDTVIVQLSVDSSNIQHEKLVIKLVKPYIKGFSVEETDVDVSTPLSNSASPPRKNFKQNK